MKTLNELARWAMGDRPNNSEPETTTGFKPTIRICDNGVILTIVYDRHIRGVIIYAFHGNVEMFSITITRYVEPYPADRYTYIIADTYDRADHATPTASEYCVYADVDDSDRWLEYKSWVARCCYSPIANEFDRELTLTPDRCPGCIEQASWNLFCRAIC